MCAAEQARARTSIVGSSSSQLPPCGGGGGAVAPADDATMPPTAAAASELRSTVEDGRLCESFLNNAFNDTPRITDAQCSRFPSKGTRRGGTDASAVDDRGQPL